MREKQDLLLKDRRPYFNHEWEAISLLSDVTDKVFLDYCCYDTIHPLRIEDGECLISAVDLYRLYAPDLEIVEQGDRIVIGFTRYDASKRELISGVPYMPPADQWEAELTIGSRHIITDFGERELKAAPERRNGICYLPILSLMSEAFGADILHFHEGGAITYWAKPTSIRDIYSISFQKTFQLNAEFAGMLTRSLDKVYGDIYRTVWFEDGKRLMPYRVYIPFGYVPDQPMPAVVGFPGGIANENSYYQRSDNKLQFYAQKHGYITIVLSGYGVSTFFGSWLPILQTLDGIDYEHMDPRNPEGWAPETMALRELAEKGMWVALEDICKRWNIDRKNLFAFGNSAGSNTATYLYLKYPGLFRAFCAMGGFVNYRFINLRDIADDAMLHIMGTEDQHGFNDMVRAYQALETAGVKYRRIVTGGGEHVYSWVPYLDDMFAFFDEKRV